MSKVHPRIVHLSTVHRALDPRIRLKQLKSITDSGLKAHLITTDTMEAPHDDAVTVERICEYRPHRWRRVFLLAPKAVWRALLTPAAVYHFHDPELIHWAWLLLLRLRPVVYDIHEDYSLALSQKNYLPGWVRKRARSIADLIERGLTLPFYRIIAERCYRTRFPRAVCILNYTPLSLLEKIPSLNTESRHLLYTGNVTIERGALNLIRLAHVCPDLEITMAGECKPDAFNRIQEALNGAEDRVHIIGVGRFVPPAEVRSLYEQNAWIAGIVLISDSPHYREKQLTKFFEYMAAGLPIIASNFPTWRRLIAGQGVGICVDPGDLHAAASAVEWLSRNPEEAKMMGMRGRELVRLRYNWEREGSRLISFYKRIAHI
jgi:glycosyltransferase involved in cell wall biosynthesis